MHNSAITTSWSTPLARVKKAKNEELAMTYVRSSSISSVEHGLRPYVLPSIYVSQGWSSSHVRSW